MAVPSGTIDGDLCASLSPIFVQPLDDVLLERWSIEGGGCCKLMEYSKRGSQDLRAT